MVALEHDRAGAEFIRPKGTARNAEQGLIVDDLHAIEDDGDMAVDQGNIEVVPLSGGFGGIGGGSDSAVDGTHAMRIGFLPVPIGNLDFVDPPKINSAVAFGRDPYIDLEVEIGKFLFGPKVAVMDVAAFGLDGFVTKDTVFGDPAVDGVRFDQAPAG